MSKQNNLFSAEEPHGPRPLQFDSYSFGADCYNTQTCSVIFMNKQQVLSKFQMEPSGKPPAPDWKNRWTASFLVMAEMDAPIPSVEVDWIALDGVERSVFVELDEIFPNHQLLHKVAREDIDEDWAIHGRHPAQILLEVNDRTISVYMRAHVYSKPQPSSPDRLGFNSDLILAWSRTY